MKQLLENLKEKFRERKFQIKGRSSHTKGKGMAIVEYNTKLLKLTSLAKRLIPNEKQK